MRDILLTLIVIAGCFFTLKRPYIGILLLSWLSFMNPQSLCYGFALNAPFAQWTGVIVFGSMLYNKETKRPSLDAMSIIWIALIVFMGVTTFFAYYSVAADLQYKEVVKIQLIMFLTLMLITNMDKLNKLIWVIVLSMGFYSVKGGFFTILTGGNLGIWGPTGTYIEDTNGLALAILMVIPLMVYLYQTNDHKWIKQGLLGAIVFSLITVLKCQSNAALLANIAVVVVYLIKRMGYLKFFGFLILFFSLIAIILSLMPPVWREAFSNDDGSNMGRINSWKFAINAANENWLGLGMGFDSWSPETYGIYSPNPEFVNSAHSIYFTILGEHGWFGLALFLLIFWMTWRKLTNIIQQTAGKKEYQQVHSLANLLTYSLIAYWAGGTFLNLAYFSLPWQLIAIVLILSRIVAAQPVQVNSGFINIQEISLIPNTSLRQWYQSKESIAEQRAWLDSVEAERAFWAWCDSKHYFMYEIGTDEEIMEKFNEWTKSTDCECTWLVSQWHQEALNRWNENHAFTS